MEHNYLLIGLGGTGGRILRELRIRFHEERNALPGNIGFLYVDSGKELMRPEDPLWLTRNGYHVCFYPSEFLNIGTIHPYTIIEHPEAFPHLKELAEGCEFLQQYQPNTGAQQNRRLGRLMLGMHIQEFQCMLNQRVSKLQQQTHDSNLQVFIMTGLCGGTGSGTIVDVVTNVLREYPKANVKVMAVLPNTPPPPRHDAGQYFQNAYAALRELNALNVGRLEMTDLSTGRHGFEFNDNQRIQKKLFGLFLFHPLHAADTTAYMVGNTLYHLMTLAPDNDPVETYIRAVNMQYIDYPENDTSIREQEDGTWELWARTKAVGMLSMLRIVYPRQEIARHIAMSIATKSYRQMCYNYFVEDVGYVDEPAPTTGDISEADIKRWGMSKEHLRVAIEADIHPKQATDGIEHHAKEIVAHYECSQIQEWADGTKGISQIIDNTSKITNHLLHRIEDNQKEAAECQSAMQAAADNASRVKNAYRSSNFITRLIRKKKLIVDYKNSLTSYYEQDKLSKALAFEQALLQKLAVDLQETETHFMQIMEILKEESRQAADLAWQETQAPANTFYAIDWSRVEVYEKRIARNRSEMDSMAAIARKNVTDHMDFTAKDFKKKVMCDLTARQVANCRHIVNMDFEYHDDYRHGDFFRTGREEDYINWYNLFHTDILNELGRNDDYEDKIISMTRLVAESESAASRFIPEEVQRHLRNNLQPGPGHCPVTTILISTPAFEDKTQEMFFHNLIGYVKEKIDFGPSVSIVTNEQSPNRDEISIAFVCNNFPIRYLKSLPSLKERYDQFMSDPKLHAAYKLHIENNYKDLPSLEVEES